MQLAGPFAFGTPPDRPLAVGLLRENLAVEGVTLDDGALRELDGVGA